MKTIRIITGRRARLAGHKSVAQKWRRPDWSQVFAPDPEAVWRLPVGRLHLTDTSNELARQMRLKEEILKHYRTLYNVGELAGPYRARHADWPQPR